MRDYKHIRYESESLKKQRKSSKKLYIFFLVLLSTMVATAIFINKRPEVAKKIEKIAEEVKSVKQEAPEKHFSFYEILAQGEYALRGNIDYKGFLDEKKEDNSIYLQVGAFKNDYEADNFEAELRLRGFKPQVQSLYLPQKEGRWFIVRVGPVNNKTDLEMLETQLNQNKVNFALITKHKYLD